MIEKYSTYLYGDNDSEGFSFINGASDFGFVKTAHTYSDELKEYIENLEEKIDKIYALVNAVAAEEYYGSNRNGDSFPEKALMDYHKTFEAIGRVYKHHVNKDPNKAYGRPIFSHYNPRMHRVELVIEVDRKKAQDIVERLNHGELPAVSMGTRVPYDVCSICGNKAKTRKDYCGHLRNQMNQVLPSGQRVFARNTMPKFFDISFVTIPAERTAGVMMVLKGKRIAMSRRNIAVLQEPKIAENSWAGAFLKQAQLETQADMQKEIPAKIDVFAEDPKKLILNSQKNMSKDLLVKLSEYPLNEVLSTLMSLRILPKREDFQKLALYSVGRKKEAELLEEKGICFEVTEGTNPVMPKDLIYENYNEKIAGLLEEEIPHMSLTRPLVVARSLVKAAAMGFDTPIIQEPLSNASLFPARPQRERSFVSKAFFGQEESPALTSQKSPIVPMGLLASLYYGYAKVFNDTTSSGFRKFIAKHPWLLAMAVGGTAVGVNWMQKKNMLEQQRDLMKVAAKVTQLERFLGSSLLTVPASYLYASDVQQQARSGKAISPTSNFVRKHPALVGMLAGAGLASAQKSVVKTLSKFAELCSQMEEDRLNTIYEDLIIT